MTEPQHPQPVTALDQMLGEIAVMHQEQVARNRQQLEVLCLQTEVQTRLLHWLLDQIGAGSPFLPLCALSGGCVAQTDCVGRAPEFS